MNNIEKSTLPSVNTPMGFKGILFCNPNEHGERHAIDAQTGKYPILRIDGIECRIICIINNETVKLHPINSNSKTAEYTLSIEELLGACPDTALLDMDRNTAETILRQQKNNGLIGTFQNVCRQFCDFLLRHHANRRHEHSSE